jgi:hypothetical protein
MVGNNTVSLPAANRYNLVFDACVNGLVESNYGNGATLTAFIYCTGSSTDISLNGNMVTGTGTQALLIDAGCDDILYDQNRFMAPTTITDNGTNSVVGTNWTT